MTFLFGLPSPRLEGVWFAEAGMAREALPAHAEQKLDRRVWKEHLPVEADHDLVFGDLNPVRSWAQSARLRQFGVVVELGSDWGPGRLILPEVHVTWDQWPYAMALQFAPDVMDQVRRARGVGDVQRRRQAVDEQQTRAGE